VERAARRLDIPAGLVVNVPKVIIEGYRELYIENHQGLMEYGDTKVHINCGGVILKLTGEGFRIRAMTAEELRLEGTLFSVEFVY